MTYLQCDYFWKLFARYGQNKDLMRRDICLKTESRHRQDINRYVGKKLLEKWTKSYRMNSKTFRFNTEKKCDCLIQSWDVKDHYYFVVSNVNQNQSFCLLQCLGALNLLLVNKSLFSPIYAKIVLKFLVGGSFREQSAFEILPSDKCYIGYIQLVFVCSCLG